MKFGMPRLPFYESKSASVPALQPWFSPKLKTEEVDSIAHFFITFHADFLTRAYLSQGRRIISLSGQ